MSEPVTIGGCTLWHANCLDVLRCMAEASVGAVVTDPPYNLGFMGKKWDMPGSFVERKPDRSVKFDQVGGSHNPCNPQDAARSRGVQNRRFQDWCEAWAREVYRVMKPGAFLVSFGGTRTYHRMVCAVEDAGFEIRDQLSWIYGTGFNKVGYIRDPATGEPVRPGWAGSLKPAQEPIVLARKPLACPTVAAQVLATGTGALNIDATRVPMGGEYDPAKVQRQSSARVTWKEGKASGLRADHEQPTYNAAGRWPANLVTDGSPEVLEAFAAFKTHGAGHARTKIVASDYDATSFDLSGDRQMNRYGDEGSPARFFPALGFGEDELRFMYRPKAGKADRCGSRHPTIKPVALMRWLCRLITPPGGTILDPFAGSGTTGEAALREGFSAVLIEREAEYHADILARLARYRDEAPLLAGAAA